VATAHDDQKFGFSLSSGAADEAVRRVLAAPSLDFAGLHSHIGSQIYDTAGFDVAAHRVLELAARIRAEHGVHIGELDLGGGFGIAYVPGDDPADIKVVAQSLHDIVRAQCAAAGLEVPRLTVEPGRAIAGPGTVTLYEVGTIKDVDGLRTYVIVDGGMSDNIRTALYGAEYTCALDSRESAAPPMLSRVVGRHCGAGTSWSGTPTCRATSRRGTWSRWRPPARTAGRWRATTTTCRGRPWSASATAPPVSCSAGKPRRTCSAWMRDDRAEPSVERGPAGLRHRRL